MAIHASDSEVQRRAEPELIRAVAVALEVPLSKRTLKLDGGSTVQIDGFNLEKKVACEAFARIGSLRAGQKRKLGNDILKLLLIERRMGGNWRKILVIAGEDAFASLTGDSWQAHAVREFGIEILRVPLAEALVAEIVAVQVRQVMTNSHGAQAGLSRVLPGVGTARRLRVGSPRLVDPSQAADFTMDVAEEVRDAGL